MAGSKKAKGKQENALVRYFRNTRSELRKVRWPTRKEAWALTKIVLLATLSMALFLGLVDLLFGRILSGIVNQNVLFIILGVIVVAILTASAFLIGQGEEV